MDNLDEEEKVVLPYAAFPVAGLAWQMFEQTGMPGFYLLYSDIERGEERSPLD